VETAAPTTSPATEAARSTRARSAAAEPVRLAARLAGKGPYLLVALAVLALDQWTKWLVELHLPLSAVQPVFPGLNLTHVRNTGVAFGLFAAPGSTSWPLALLGMAALGAVVFYFVLAPRAHRLLLSALGLILGGAVGNLLDRLASGAVTDFIDVYVGDFHWYFFNAADSAITVGIVLMAFESLRPHRHREEVEGGAAPNRGETGGDAGRDGRG
jgi:signal peptidase II